MELMDFESKLSQESTVLEQPVLYENLCLGIDFGTTNSCISVWFNNKPLLVPDFDGTSIIPTVIEINPDKKIIGKEAYLRKDIFEKTNNLDNIQQKTTFLVYEIKKLLGKKYSDLTKQQIDMIAYNIESDQDDNIIIIDKNTLKTYYPEEIAIHIFMSFKARAETFLSNKLNTQINITNSVISVPAYFNKIQREIIKNSAENAGLKVIRLINEPTAAAICYGLGKNSTSSGLNIIVFDFGGGTLDVSLLSINDGIYEVLASCGNNNLGGSDFDKKIMEFCINKFIEKFNLEPDDFIEKVNENSLQKLKFLSEQAKIALSNNNLTKIKIDNFYNDYSLNVSINRDEFTTITQDLIRLIVKPVNDVLESCELEKKDIDEIIMVGGMTRVPMVRYNIERFFNRDVNCSIDPDTVVSIGASIHGYMILNKTSIQDKLLLIDRTSLSIGLETSGGLMDILIPRGTIIPIKKTKKYTTDTDYMESIDIKIYEGERKFTKDNFLIGDFTLTGIEKQKRGIPEIQITFEIDSDGIIKIKAEDLDNPLNKKTILVSGNKQNLSKEQIEEIINSAKQMDQIDRIDKIKKESYMSLIDSSKKIIENVNCQEVQIPEDVKNDIINNVQEILNWLQDNKYENIDVDKYKELLHDYKINYSIYLIQQTTPVINLESANEEETKAVEIYDDDNNSKKYSEQIKYFRQIIDQYDDIKKQIQIAKYMDDINLKENIQNTISTLSQELNFLYDYTNDVLIKIFTEKNINDEIITEFTSKVYELDVAFKEKFNEFDNEFNMINKILTTISDKEEKLLVRLEYLNNLTSTTETESYLENINNKEIEDINKKLDIIISIQSIIYEINLGYSKFDNKKIIEISRIIDSIDVNFLFNNDDKILDKNLENTVNH